jgi:hypothetical protein
MVGLVQIREAPVKGAHERAAEAVVGNEERALQIPKRPFAASTAVLP